MTLSLRLVLLIVAAVLFFVAGWPAVSARVNLVAIGLGLATVAEIIR